MGDSIYKSDITNTIANNLRNIRAERRLTLQDLAEITGVSKSMLGGIERGASSPTITVLWKISTGLNIPISKLIHEKKSDCFLVRETEWRILQNAPNDISLIFEAGQDQNFEVYHIEFQPGAVYKSHSHQKGVIEYTMVYEGAFTIIVGEEPHLLEKGDSFIFNADIIHSYRNDGLIPTKAYSIIHYS
ncbi:MAG: XRE family transcriptional regulator [Synergistaceae bacterium]|jgi:transcriptional regulator with XRE-family HTH domain|nr:XRE family transcriptional regulator [Synergistaceae bacterium]